jgi:hypothetical protein
MPAPIPKREAVRLCSVVRVCGGVSQEIEQMC